MARYHLAAQAAVPVLAAWQDVQKDSAAEYRDVQRTRFQLDAPLTAGRSFFEMVTFMLTELRQLRTEFYEPTWQEFASTDDEFREKPGRSRLRYVSELYLAAALYYSNRFGEAETAEARERLFRWAYALRVNQTRVLFRSVDNLARLSGAESAFWLIRNTSSPTELRRLTPRALEPISDRDPELVTLLSGLESA
jgi:hypothetical protein